MDIHLYLMCYRTEALVASHLAARDFAAYMAVGTKKNTHGNVLFFEIDPAFRSAQLNLDQVEAKCVAHQDGRPRRSKYLSLYRVMERIPLAAYGKLHLATRDGRILSLEGYDSSLEPQHDGPYLYAELCPLTCRVASRLNPTAFINHFTNPDNAIWVPRLFFVDTQFALDTEGRMEQYLPYRNPDHIADCLLEVEHNRQKISKTVDRNPPLNAFYRTIASGFYLGDSSGAKIYPYPKVATLEADHHKWWRSATMG